MAGEWQRHEVSQLMEDSKLVIGDGYRAKNDELASSGLPFARASNINDGFRFDNADHFPEENLVRVGNKTSQPGDVVFTSKGTVGRFAFVQPVTARFVYSPQLCFWRSLDHSRIYPHFLYYWMLGREFFVQFKGVAGQTDMAEYVSLTDQRRMYITLPPLREQRAIARILGTLDDKIELNRRMNETLETMARSLFKSWFVDFDPVRAKAEGRDPDLPRPLADLFPDSFEGSELGEIPKGWRVLPLAECVDAARGLSYKGSGLSDSGLPMHNLNSIYEGGGYKHEGIKHYEGDYRPHHVARAGDLIVANTEQGHNRLLIGYAAIVPVRFDGESLYSHHIYRVRPRSSYGLTPDYLCHLLNTRVMHDTVSGYANGTTVNMLPIDGLQSPKVFVPNSRIVAAFNDIAEAARKRHEEMVEESRTLAALRDILLPKLISGELRVPFQSDVAAKGPRHEKDQRT